MEAIIATVVGGLTVAGILGALRWLRVEDNRERVRQALCRHQWRSLDERNSPGSPIVIVSPYAEECVKCGARR